MKHIAKQQIAHIISDLDNNYHQAMIQSEREEELYEKKYAISDWIYCLYANDNKAENPNPDYKGSLGALIEQFYGSKENIVCWDKNWTFNDNSTVYARRFGKFCIAKSGEYKLVSPEDFISSSDNARGHKYVDLKIRRIEISDDSWFYFRGNKYLGTAFLTRIYFNFNYDFEKISSFSKQLCDELNNWLIPFEYKFATKNTGRYDKGVLYTAREHYYTVFHLIKKLASAPAYTHLFADGTLAFTKKTSLKGISFGEEPPIRSSSFGRYRADMMADIYIDYYKSLKKNKKTAGLEVFFRRKLNEVGFNISDFFRNPHTHYPYDFSVFRKKISTNKSIPPFIPDKYLTWALNAGKLICKQAIIIEQKGVVGCGWMSIIEDEFQDTEFRLIDNSFNEGRLGIVYFLASLYRYFPGEYIFKDICEIVMANILSADTPLSVTDTACINQIKKWLKAAKDPSLTPKPANCLVSGRAQSLKDKVDLVLRQTNTYSPLENDAPQPIINKGYAAIGLILLALFENNTEALADMDAWYGEEAFFKLINQTMF